MLKMSFRTKLIADALEIFLRIAKIIIVIWFWRTVGGELSYIVGGVLNVLYCWRVIDGLGVEWTQIGVRLSVGIRICLLGGNVAGVS